MDKSIIKDKLEAAGFKYASASWFKTYNDAELEFRLLPDSNLQLYGHQSAVCNPVTTWLDSYYMRPIYCTRKLSQAGFLSLRFDIHYQLIDGSNLGIIDNIIREFELRHGKQTEKSS